MALLFWVSLAGGILTKGVPLFFVMVPMVVLSLATGSLPEQLRKWRSHFHLTGMRIGIGIALGVGTIVLALGVAEYRWSVVVIGGLMVGMVFTPGLPGILVHCVAGGNWRWWRGLRPMMLANLW